MVVPREQPRASQHGAGQPGAPPHAAPQSVAPQYFPAPPARAPRSRRVTALVGALLSVGLVMVAGIGYGGWRVYRATHEYFGGCVTTRQTAGDLADALAPAGFRVAGVRYTCRGDLQGVTQDQGYLALRSDRSYGSRDAVWQAARDALLARGWSAGGPWTAPDSIDGGADAGLDRGRFSVDVIGWSVSPAAVQLWILNSGPQTTGGPDHDPLPPREPSLQDRDQLSRTPGLAIGYVPPGHRGWRWYTEPSTAEGGSPIQDDREYWLFYGGGRFEYDAVIRSERVAPGRDLSTQCGDGLWGPPAEVVCRVLGTTANGQVVYLPERKEDGSYGPAVALLGGALVSLSGVVPHEDGDPAPTSAPNATGPRLLPLSRSQILTLFGSINVSPGAVRG